jgi:hypothetical protein
MVEATASGIDESNGADAAGGGDEAAWVGGNCGAGGNGGRPEAAGEAAVPGIGGTEGTGGSDEATGGVGGSDETAWAGGSCGAGGNGGMGGGALTGPTCCELSIPIIAAKPISSGIVSVLACRGASTTGPPHKGQNGLSQSMTLLQRLHLFIF